MKRGGRSPGFCNPARRPGNARVSATGAFVSERLHFVADVPASLEAARLGCLAVGLRRDLPYALAGACVNANVADASASASAANLPLPLKIIVSLGDLLPHALLVRRLCRDCPSHGYAYCVCHASAVPWTRSEACDGSCRASWVRANLTSCRRDRLGLRRHEQRLHSPHK